MATDKATLREQGICVIIPTYNNAGTIGQVIQSVSDYCDDIFVVCDGPTDGTEELVRQCATPVQVVAYHPNKGKGRVTSRKVKSCWIVCRWWPMGNTRISIHLY